MNCSDVDVPNVEVAQTKTLKLRPLGDRILVRVIKVDEDVAVNGVCRVGEAIEKPRQGEVVAVGKGRLVNGSRVPVDVKEGELVVFGKYSGNDVEVLGEKLLLIQEDELMGSYYAV